MNVPIILLEENLRNNSKLLMQMCDIGPAEK